MGPFKITDWDDAYTNKANVPNGERWPEVWVKPAIDFRNAVNFEADVVYGSHDRNRYDLFHPKAESKGLLVFVHGGYWMALDKSYWSHLARGALDAGWTVAIPSYVLCPEVTIKNITHMIADAVMHAADNIKGPIILCGHSAGGHLVSSMLNTDAPLPAEYQQRIRHVVSISGVHDLRPLLKTTMNDTLNLDSESAADLSLVLKQPLENCRLTAWVGSGERAEFIRQSQLIANIWRGLGAQTQCVIEPDKHHFNIIDTLADLNSPLMKTILSE